MAQQLWRDVLPNQFAYDKACLLITGLWMLLRPERPAPNAAFHEGQIFARAAGGLLLILAAIPYRGPRGRRCQEKTAEDL